MFIGAKWLAASHPLGKRAIIADPLDCAYMPELTVYTRDGVINSPLPGKALSLVFEFENGIFFPEQEFALCTDTELCVSPPC